MGHEELHARESESSGLFRVDGVGVRLNETPTFCKAVYIFTIIIIHYYYKL
jgi:hypothetical protein